jgi:hypothetical protein
MELLIVVIALCLLGLLANRYGHDSRDRFSSDEERLSAQGLRLGQPGWAARPFGPAEPDAPPGLAAPPGVDAQGAHPEWLPRGYQHQVTSWGRASVFRLALELLTVSPPDLRACLDRLLDRAARRLAASRIDPPSWRRYSRRFPPRYAWCPAA